MEQAQDLGEQVHIVKTDLWKAYGRVTLPGLTVALERKKGNPQPFPRAYLRGVLNRSASFFAPGAPETPPCDCTNVYPSSRRTLWTHWRKSG